MKSRIIIIATVLSALMIFGAWTAKNLDDKNSFIIKLVMQGLSSSHYHSVAVDNSFSEEAFDLYIKRIDYRKRYLLQSDIDQFKKYRDDIDDEAQRGSYELFDLSYDVLTERLDETQGYYRKILAKPFDFNVNEKINMDIDERDFVDSKDALKDRWRKLLKYQTLVRIHNMQADQAKEVEDDETTEILSFEEIEKKARKRVLKSYDDNYIRMEKNWDKKFWRTNYINSIVNIFDPHTTYYPPKNKKDFDERFSGQFEGIGARLLEQVDGYIKVTEVIPGGPASKQGQLQANDLIIKVAQDDGKEAVSIVDMRIADAVKLIKGKKGTKVALTVKRADGNTEVITITRDVVLLEETFAKSALLNDGSSSLDFGYINLPGFYADFSGKGGRSCADDVKKEIEKLKKQGVRGIVLDLRNNGGGSLYDAIEMGGLFIESGPIVQVKSRGRAPQVLKDNDLAVQYDGPLVILVNHNSASASEILAAAMQDYKRAVIIGSPSTFGKGTVQRFFDLDRFVEGQDEFKPLGSIKLTTQKFYRINGGATQLKGVIPDVIIPDNYSYLDNGEKERDNAMAWDEIDPVNFKSWVSTGVYRKRAIKNSNSRVSKSDIFSRVDQNAHRFKRQRDVQNYPLELSGYKKFRKDRKSEADQYKDMFQAIPDFSIKNLASDLAHIQEDSTRAKINDKWVETLCEDPYLYEAVQTLKDLK